MPSPSQRKTTAPQTLGDLIVAVDDRAARHTCRAQDRRRLAAVLVTATLLANGNRSALRRLSTRLA